jgi:CheY-like chemotaxis protein
MKQLHLLIIDDDPAIRDTLFEWLGRFQNHTVCTARDSEEGLEQMQYQAFDAIITDIHHPGLDGLTFTKLIYHCGGPPVIIITGYHNPECRHHAYANGARAFLRKPYDLEEIRDVVHLVADKGVHYIGKNDG